jgi:ABC-type dipeptide/oligopeptide/nickel transport system permease component
MGMSVNSTATDPNYSLVAQGPQAWSNTKEFFEGLIQGDLGTVNINNVATPVTDILGAAYVNSMGLMLIALFVSAGIGIFLGSRSAIKRHTQSPTLLLTLTVLGISIPSFFAALLLQQGAIRYQQEFGRRLVSMSGFGWDKDHLLLPVIVLAARPLAYLTRASFISLGTVLDRDYIRTAYAKGLRRYTIYARHAFRNLAIPILTAIGVSLRFSLSTLPIVEFFFNWPGLGFHVLNAINNRQTDLVVAIAFAFGLTLLLINFALDFTYRLIDPRIQAEGEI